MDATARLGRELERLRVLLDGGGLSDGAGLLGVEVEFQLVDADGLPAPRNAEVLAALADGPLDVQAELARFNLELNLPPVALDGAPLRAVREGIDAVRAAVADADPGTTAVTIGTLPTLTEAHLVPAAISVSERYHQLDARIMAARGGSLHVAIDARSHGGEHLEVTLDTILLEAAATSLQVHLDLPADGFVAAWNTAQAVAAIQVAVGANAPLLLGRALWHESRIPIFEQVIDVRSDDDAGRGVQPRVWFGSRYLTHPVEPFAENLAHFAPLLDVHVEEQEDGPFDALILHNGTVWRWNRPVLAHDGGRTTLRLENRVLGAPPTSHDGAADVALIVGLIAGLRDDVDRLTACLPFAVAEHNFRHAAEVGAAAGLRWPDARSGALRDVTVAQLLGGGGRAGVAGGGGSDGLLATVATGLARLGVPSAEADDALDVIAARAASGRTGAAWQLATFRAECERHDRPTALARTVRRYRELQSEGEPVHRWPLPTASA